jgi:hypothetical protein
MSPDDVSARTATVTVTKTEAPDINTVLAKFTVSIMVLNKTAEEQYEDMIAAKVSSATDIGGSVYGVTLDAVTGMTNDRLTKLFNRLNDGRNYKVDLSACSGISNWTFSHGNMEFVNELILPPGVQTISSGFGGSLNASPLKISGTGVTIIRASAFVSSRIQEAAFTALQNIETLAFHGCGSLASLTVNKNRVTELAASVFSNNSVPAGTLNVIVGNETGVGVTGYTASTYWAAANVSGGTAPDKYGANHKAIKILAAP